MCAGGCVQAALSAAFDVDLRVSNFTNGDNTAPTGESPRRGSRDLGSVLHLRRILELHHSPLSAGAARGAESTEISEAESGVVHFARVRAVTAVGASEWATVSEGRLLLAYPGAPALLSLSSGGFPAPYLRVVWNEPVDAGAGPAGGAGLLSEARFEISAAPDFAGAQVATLAYAGGAGAEHTFFDGAGAPPRRSAGGEGSGVAQSSAPCDEMAPRAADGGGWGSGDASFRYCARAGRPAGAGPGGSGSRVGEEDSKRAAASSRLLPAAAAAAGAA